MFKLLNKKKNNKGFTLVELVIVVAILAILVGILAPQYTKYVEKTRKTADASNMDEIVKVIKVFAADPAAELPAKSYVVTIGDSTTTVTDSDKNTGLKAALDEAVPKWATTGTKSKKWGKNGEKKNIIATVTVKDDGGTSVAYTTEDDTAATNKFATYMAKGSEK